jgi:hypothetical protein
MYELIMSSSPDKCSIKARFIKNPDYSGGMEECISMTFVWPDGQTEGCYFESEKLFETVVKFPGIRAAICNMFMEMEK